MTNHPKPIGAAVAHEPKVTVSAAQNGGWIAQVSHLERPVGTESEAISAQTRAARRLVCERYDVVEITGDATADDHTILVFFRGHRR